MSRFSETSKKRLESCDTNLIKLFDEVVKYYDCSILCGHRSEQEQNEAYNNKRSMVKWPNSKHNKVPSRAVDAAPYPVDWAAINRVTKLMGDLNKLGKSIKVPGLKSDDLKDYAKFYYFVAFVKATAIQLGIHIRCGADWDGDFDLKDQNFDDLPHFELLGG